MKKVGSFSSLSIRGRLFLGFSMIILTLLIAVIITLIRINTVHNSIEQLLDNDMPTYDNTVDLSHSIYDLKTSFYDWMLTQNPHSKTLMATNWNNINRLQSRIENFSKKWSDKNSIQLWQSVKLPIEQLKDLQSKLTGTTDTTTASEIITTEIVPTIHKIFDILNGPLDAEGQRSGGLLTFEYDRLSKNSQAVIIDISVIETIEYSLLIISIIISFLVVYFTTRGILKYVDRMQQHSKKIASGDLTHRIKIENDDEFGQLGNDLNIMTDNLVKIIKLITQASLFL